MSPRAKRASRKAKKGPAADVVRTRRPSGGLVRMVAVRLPVAYLRIVEAEGLRLNLSRGQFFTMLVKKQQGVVLMERPPGAPNYDSTAKEMEATKLYMWQAPAEVRERIDAERLRMGNIAVSAYLIHLVNHWLGQPMGLKLKGGATKRS